MLRINQCCINAMFIQVIDFVLIIVYCSKNDLYLKMLKGVLDYAPTPENHDFRSWVPWALNRSSTINYINYIQCNICLKHNLVVLLCICSCHLQIRNCGFFTLLIPFPVAHSWIWWLMATWENIKLWWLFIVVTSCVWINCSLTIQKSYTVTSLYWTLL